MIFTDCVTEPVVVKTVSKLTVSDEKFRMASLLVMKESFLQEKIRRKINDGISSIGLFIVSKILNSEGLIYYYYNGISLLKLFEEG